MEYANKSKILIAGPTGTGTTFLLGLLHRLGLQTGFDDEAVTKTVSGRGKGLEYVRGNPTRKPWLAERKRGVDISPRVIKQPIQDYGDDGGTGIVCDVLDIVDENGWDVEHLFLTVRNLTSIVESIERRMKTGDSVMFKVQGDEAKRQRELLAAEGFYKLACKLALRDLPYTLIEFPQSVEDPEYCFRRIHAALGKKFGKKAFMEAHAATARRNMVHVKRETTSMLIMYWHGLGDLLCLTPQLRHLHEHGFKVDLLVRPQVLKSSLLSNCPYVEELIPLPFTKGGPSEGGESGKKKSIECNEMFDSLAGKYDKAVRIAGLHSSLQIRGGKIFRNSRAIFNPAASKKDRAAVKIMPPEDLSLEVFIPKGAKGKARKYIAEHYPNGFIFKHTTPEYHPIHCWEADEWIRANLNSELPIFEASSSPWASINPAFVMAREATHRVLSSSVFVHACDAMGVTMDVVYYGQPALHALPLDPNKTIVVHGEHGIEDNEK